MAQWVKLPTLGFSSGHDLMVHGFELHIGLHTDSAEPALDSLSLPFSLPLPCSLSLSLSTINKQQKKKKKKRHQSLSFPTPLFLSLHAHTPRKGHVSTHREGSHLQPKGRVHTSRQPHWHLDLGFPVSITVIKQTSVV